MASKSDTIESVEPTEDSKRRASHAIQSLMRVIENKLGDPAAFGETIVRVRWQRGQIEHVKIVGEDDYK